MVYRIVGAQNVPVPCNSAGLVCVTIFMFETVLFLTFLGLTLASVVVTLIFGLKKRRRAHLVSAITTAVLLVVAIVFALLLGQVRDFPSDEMAIHKIFSNSGAYLFLVVVFTGSMLWKSPGWRWAHRICIGLFLVAALCATVTGFWVFALSTPIPAPGLP